MAAAPTYTAVPLIGAVLVNNATADTSFSAPTHAVVLVTAGANGSKVNQIDLIPAGTISAGGVVVNIFLYNGTTFYLHESVLVPAVTPGTQLAPAKISFRYDDLVIPSGWFLYATETVITQPVQVNAYGGSF